MSLLLRSFFASVLGLSATLPAHADSFTSSAASAASQSVGAMSNSITHSSQGSSRASSPGAPHAGDYDVTHVAELGGERNLVRVHLAPTKAVSDAAKAGARDADTRDAGTFTLDLPRAALGTRGLAAGDVVNVRHRPYGLEFARANTGDTFFLAVADAWLREMEARPI